MGISLRFLMFWARFWGFILLLGGCGGDTASGLKPPASYIQGQLLVIIDTAEWRKPLGVALRQEMAAPVAGLPQKEPSFDVLRTAASAFNTTLQRAAGLLFVVLTRSSSDENLLLQYLFRDYVSQTASLDSARLHFFRDLYAQGQQAALLLAPNSHHAMALLSEKGPLLRQYFLKQERKQLMKKLSAVTNDTLATGLQKRHGFLWQIPKSYALAKEEKDFIWLRYLDKTLDKNLFLHHAPYRDSSVFSQVAKYRESITQAQLRDSKKPHLYITLQEEVPLLSEPISFQGRYALRNCGLWKLSDHSIGGPWVGYLIPDTQQGRVYYLEAFLYHPGGKKRDLLREMEAILWTFSLPSSAKKAN